MGPILLVDKSTVQGLNPEEIVFLHKHYMVVISSILMRELLSNLAKETTDRQETERRLSALAGKVGMYDSKVVADARSIAASNLFGDHLPMDGRIPMAGWTRVRSKDGRMGIIFDEPPEKKVLREWKYGQFTLDEKEKAKQIRQIDLEVDLYSIKETISKDLSHFPKFKSLIELVAWIDQTFLPLTDQRSHLISASSAVLNPQDVEIVLGNWEKAGNPLFSEFAPYAYYFYRCNVIYYLGLGQGFISPSRKAKTHLDIQYFYYLPFCMVLSSGDSFFRDMLPHFKRDNQFFLWKDDLKADLIAIKSHWNGMTEEEKKKFRIEFGDYPPDLPGSITAQLWKALMRPRPKEPDIAPKLSREQEQKLASKIMSLYSGAIRIEDEKSVDPTFTDKFKGKDLKERSYLLLEKCAQVFGLDAGKDWGDVKKQISGEHVKEIYDFYADLWRPDTDLLKLLSPDRGKLRVLYLGEIDPYSIMKNVIAATLYFDQICVIDPFLNPWSMKEDYNPISNPEQFKSDLLKITYFLIFLWPWIESDQIVLVPEPTNLMLSLKKDIMNIAMEKRKSFKLTTEEEKEAKEHERHTREHLMRFIRRLPEDAQKRYLKKAIPTITDAEMADFIKMSLKLRSEDPLAIDRPIGDGEEGQLFLLRSGANLETSLLLCQLIGSAPFTPLLIRANEYYRLKAAPSNRWKSFCELFSQHDFYFLDYVEPSFVPFLKDKGHSRNLRSFLKHVVSRLNSDEPISDSEVQDLTSQLPRHLDELKKEWEALKKAMEQSEHISKDFQFRKVRLSINIEESGYVSTDVNALWTKHFASAVRSQVRICFHVIPQEFPMGKATK